jgi:hypothetical protein
MVAILAVILFLMQVTGTSNIEAKGFGDFLRVFFTSPKGLIFTGALVVWSACYPAFKDRLKRKEI